MAKRRDRKRINWFPGHMARATRELREVRNMIDAIVEVADARLPRASRNPIFLKDAPDKQHLLVLSHADLADPAATKLWLDDFTRLGVTALACDLLNARDIESIRDHLLSIHKPLLEIAQARGRRSRPLRVVVTGVPNTGKSTLINQLVGKRSRNVAARPGVTRKIEWLRSGSELTFLDTPGILPTRIEDEKEGLALAAAGLIDDTLFSVEQVALALTRLLLKHYPEEMLERYGVSLDPNTSADLALVEDDGDVDLFPGGVDAAKLIHSDSDLSRSKFNDTDLTRRYADVDHLAHRDDDTTDLAMTFRSMALRMGCVLSDDEPDIDRMSRVLLSDFRSGRIGRITLEHVLT